MKFAIVHVHHITAGRAPRPLRIAPWAIATVGEAHAGSQVTMIGGGVLNVAESPSELEELLGLDPAEPEPGPQPNPDAPKRAAAAKGAAAK